MPPMPILNGPSIAVVASTVFGLASLTCLAQTTESLPEQLPHRAVTATEALQEVVRAAEMVDLGHQRQNALTRVLYDVADFDRAELSPVVDCVERALPPWPKLGDATIAASVLARKPPQLVLRICQGVESPRVRDECLRNYVGASADRPSELLPLLSAIERPATRAQAWISLARNDRATWERAKQAMTEAQKFGDVAEAAGNIYALGVLVSRFAKDDPDAVADFLRTVLPPQTAVVAIGHASVYCDFQHKSPTAAARLLEQAAALVPSCPDPAAAATQLMQAWLAKHHPTVALELFDKYIEQKIEQTPDHPISYLWPAGLTSTLERVERFCSKRGIPKDPITARVLGRVASFDGPELATDWLQAAPPSRLRDEATVEIISGLTYRISYRQPDRNVAVGWVETATRHALAIEDKALRAKACERMTVLVGALRLQPAIALPPAIRDEYAKLWPQIESTLDADERSHRVAMPMRLLPIDVQVRAIREAIAASRVRMAATRVWQSDLSSEVKATWYAQILTLARAIPELPKRSAALTGIAQCFRHDNPERCLSLLWEGLRISQSIGLKPEYHDSGDALGTTYPLVTPDECMRIGFDRLPTDDRSIQALWSFARKLDRPDEQDPVLEKCVALLLRQGLADQAAGVTDLIADPARRARSWGAVAVVKKGKPLRNDW